MDQGGDLKDDRGDTRSGVVEGPRILHHICSASLKRQKRRRRFITRCRRGEVDGHGDLSLGMPIGVSLASHFLQRLWSAPIDFIQNNDIEDRSTLAEHGTRVLLHSKSKNKAWLGDIRKMRFHLHCDAMNSVVHATFCHGFPVLGFIHEYRHCVHKLLPLWDRCRSHIFHPSVQRLFDIQRLSAFLKWLLLTLWISWLQTQRIKRPKR